MIMLCNFQFADTCIRCITNWSLLPLTVTNGFLLKHVLTYRQFGAVRKNWEISLINAITHRKRVNTHQSKSSNKYMGRGLSSSHVCVHNNVFRFRWIFPNVNTPQNGNLWCLLMIFMLSPQRGERFSLCGWLKCNWVVI